MTTSQMNAEVLRNLSILAESEEMFARAAKYLCKLVKEQQQKTDPILMSKESRTIERKNSINCVYSPNPNTESSL